MKRIDRTGEEGFNSFGSKMIISGIEKEKIQMYIFLNTTGLLSMQDIAILKKEKLNVHMNLDILVKVIQAKESIKYLKIEN